MKELSYLVWLLLMAGSLWAQDTATIVLPPPDTTRGLPVMKALLLRQSASEFDTAGLTTRDLSDLLWAANGINRPASGKRTAPSAMNAQDIDVYVFLASGAYLYDAAHHALGLVNKGDHRALFAGRREHELIPPVICLLVSDVSRFRSGEDTLRLVWAAEDAGIVSQNISLFCASVGLATRPRAGMNQPAIRELLVLKKSQHAMLNHPVSYRKR